MIFRGYIPGPAVEQARPRAARTGMGVRIYDPVKVKNYKAFAKMHLSKYRLKRLLDGPLAMDIEVFIVKPKSWPKRRKHADTKPDLDNFAKCICDILEGLAYTNDSRVVDLHARKLLSDQPGVNVMVRELDDNTLQGSGEEETLVSSCTRQR